MIQRRERETSAAGSTRRGSAGFQGKLHVPAAGNRKQNAQIAQNVGQVAEYQTGNVGSVMNLSEFRQQRQELEQAQEVLLKELRPKQVLINHFIPMDFKQQMMTRATYDDKEDKNGC